MLNENFKPKSQPTENIDCINQEISTMQSAVEEKIRNNFWQTMNLPPNSEFEIDEEDLEEMIEQEKKFIDIVWRKYNQFTQPENLVVLFDVDDNIGKQISDKIPQALKEKYDLPDRPFLMRPALPVITKQMLSRHSQLGILSSRYVEAMKYQTGFMTEEEKSKITTFDHKNLNRSLIEVAQTLNLNSDDHMLYSCGDKNHSSCASQANADFINRITDNSSAYEFDDIKYFTTGTVQKLTELERITSEDKSHEYLLIDDCSEFYELDCKNIACTYRCMPSVRIYKDYIIFLYRQENKS